MYFMKSACFSAFVEACPIVIIPKVRLRSSHQSKITYHMYYQKLLTITTVTFSGVISESPYGVGKSKEGGGGGQQLTTDQNTE